MHPIRVLFLLTLLCAGRLAAALAPQENSVFVRVADVGPGLCTVAVIKDGGRVYYMIYDAGPPDRNGRSTAAIRELIPEGSNVDLLVLSHSDADHIGSVSEICDMYVVKRILRTGDPRTSKTWKTAMGAIAREVQTDGAQDINLATTPFTRGSTFFMGDAAVTMVYGLPIAPEEWKQDMNDGESNNCISIVMRLSYDGRSVLLCGDTVGRHIKSPPLYSAFSEEEMVKREEAIPVRSDVIIAPHHGADNGSSADFIKAVKPRYVVFSSGHAFHHPRLATVDRFRKFAHVSEKRFFRTDRGDDEENDKPGEEDWAKGQRGFATDELGRDAVDILITKKEGRRKGALRVEYANDAVKKE